MLSVTEVSVRVDSSEISSIASTAATGTVSSSFAVSISGSAVSIFTLGKTDAMTDSSRGKAPFPEIFPLLRSFLGENRTGKVRIFDDPFEEHFAMDFREEVFSTSISGLAVFLPRAFLYGRLYGGRGDDKGLRTSARTDLRKYFEKTLHQGETSLIKGSKIGLF